MGRDAFGAGLVAGELDGDGYPDLAIGVPLDTVGGATHAGFTLVLRGGATGLTARGSTTVMRSMTGAPEERAQALWRVHGRRRPRRWTDTPTLR